MEEELLVRIENLLKNARLRQEAAMKANGGHGIVNPESTTALADYLWLQKLETSAL